MTLLRNVALSLPALKGRGFPRLIGDVARARNISELNADKRIMFLQIGDLFRQKFIHCSGNTPIPPYSKLANR